MPELSLSADQTLKAERYKVPGEWVPAWAALALALLGTFGTMLATALVLDPALETRLMARQGDRVERHEPRWAPATSEVGSDGSVTELLARDKQTIESRDPDRPSNGHKLEETSVKAPVSNAAAVIGTSVPSEDRATDDIADVTTSKVTELSANTAESPELQPVPAMASISPEADVESDIPATGGPTDEIRLDGTHLSAIQAGDCAPLFLVTFSRGGTKPIAQELQERTAKLGVWLGTHPLVRLHLDGHADRSGPDEVNMLLSYRRAKAVAALLTAAGVPSGQLSLGAYGESLPAEGLPPESAENRRVSMRVDGIPECTDTMNEGETR